MNSNKDPDAELLVAIGATVRVKRTALGLSQKGFAEKSNLHATYVSELEKGARNLSVKALSQIATALNLTVSELFALAEATAKAFANPMTILLVEDNKPDVHLIEQALMRKIPAPHCHVVADGATALQFLKRKGEFKKSPVPDLIILDLNLPKKSGSEVLAELKADSKLKNIPVVIFSTSSARDDIQKSYDLNANCFITKPEDVDEFFSTISTIHDYWFSTVQLPSIGLK
ncbi:MAG: response regulator [Leptolyngbya sp.]|nr:response regulator [Candidatus Melainabacteria bacterium]